MGLDRLDAADEAFAHGVGITVAKVGEGVFEVSIKHLGYADDWPQLTTRCPTIPAIEEFAGVAREASKMPGPKPTNLLLTLGSRSSCSQEGLELHGTKMSPRSLRL